MRVMLVTNGLRYGGAERIVEALATDLAKCGDQVSVVATTRGGPIRDQLRARGIQVSVLHIATRGDARVPLKLANVARRFRPDVIHSHLAVADIASALASFVLPGVRLVSTVHNPGIELDPVKMLLWRTALRRFDKVLAVSEKVRSTLDPALHPEVVRPSLVEIDDVQLLRSEARRILGVAEPTPLVLSIGRLEAIKGFDVLARAAEQVKTPAARFIVIGGGAEAERLSHTRLELAGEREDAAGLLAAADLVVCPSRSEGFPQIPIHAMAASLPVVATRVGGTPEAVADGETGILVRPEDPEALAFAIDSLLQDRDRAARLGRAGRERIVREGLSRAAMVSRTREVYERTLDARARGGDRDGG